MYTKWLYWAVGGTAAWLGFMAWKRTGPPPSRNLSDVNQSLREAPFSIDAGISGVFPIVTFPDINGTSANVPMPT